MDVSPARRAAERVMSRAMEREREVEVERERVMEGTCCASFVNVRPIH